MVRRPNTTSNQSDSDFDAEETLRIDHARWSGFRDGVGEREDGVDEQGFSIELLRLRKELGSFALPLTDRILRLIDFDRPGATRALRVDQDENSPRLVLVSERAHGYRLSELLERGAERGVIPDLGAALYIMRRLLSTAAAIHRATGVGHLAIAPERILITPRGAVVIVEAALAGAIEAFRDRMPAAVRKALRLPRLEAADGPHVDIARITIAGMSMIVGRPLDPSEEIDPLSPVVQEVIEVAAVRAGDQFAAALTPWLDHAISVDPLLAFGDFADASADLEGIVPPTDARCSISRASLRKFLDDLSIDRSALEPLEQDRVREIRGRQVRRGLVAFTAMEEAPDAAAASDVLEDPAAAIMEMPVAVEDLSTEIFNQPIVIDDQPSAMAAVIDQAAPAVDDDEHDIHIAESEGKATFAESVSEEATGEFGVVGFADQRLETSIGDISPYDETTRSFEETPPSIEETPSFEDMNRSFEETTSSFDETTSSFEETTPLFQETTASLDDLLAEILRRGSEPDVPEFSANEELVDLQPGPSYVFADAPAEPPVDEPPDAEPPVDEPVTEEPPAEEPPPYEPPVEDPPPDDAPTEERPPMWLRAAIEQVARSRHDRPAPPPPRQADMRGPVFELHDEPERELEPETTTLSDIAKELGLTIPVADIKPKIEDQPPPPEDEEKEFAIVEEEAAWDSDIRRTLFAADPPPPPAPPALIPPPPAVVAAPLPVFEPLAQSREVAREEFTPLPTVVRDSSPVFEEVPPARVVVTAPAPPPVARASIAERTADIRESGGRFLKLAATLALVIGGLGAAAYGGWRYYSSLTTPGTLVVESSPPGAQVEIDGKQRGTTPAALELPPGSHEVALTRRGITRRFKVSVRAGEQTKQTLDWSIVREAGSLAVSTEPTGAKVSVDGKAVGVTPLTIPDLPAGRRRVVLEGPGGTIRREVTIEADKTTTLSEAIFSGFLAVFAPVELQIFEGSRLLGTTENNRIMIPAGRHELTLVNRELGSRLSRTVDVEPGQVAAINITEVPVTVQPASDPPPPPQ